MLKWIKSKLTRKNLPKTRAQEYTQVWKEMQISLDELSQMDDNHLIREVTLLSQMFGSSFVFEVIQDFNGELEGFERQVLEDFYLFVNTEMGLNAD